MTYSMRSSKAGYMRKKKNQDPSQENLQKIISHNKKLSIVKPAETGFWRKKNNDASFRESSLGVDGKEVGSMREGRQADGASKVSTDNDLNKGNFLYSKTNTRKRRSRKRRNTTSSNARQVSVSEQGVFVSKESENIDSAKNDDIYPEILSKFHMKKEKNPNQGMPVKQDSSGVQMNCSVIAIDNNDLHCSRRRSLKIPELKTYSRRCKSSGQQGKCPRRSSYLNSWDKNDLYNGSSSIIDASEADCKRVENDNASLSESLLNAKRDGGPPTNTQTCPTNLTHSDINSNFHKVNMIVLGGIKKPRRRRKKKKKIPVCNNPQSISEQRESVSKESENIGSVENGDLHLEILSKSDMEKANNIDQRMSVKQESSGVQLDSTVITVNKSDLHRSPGCTPKIPAVKWSLSSTSGARTSNSCSGLKAEDSRVESPAREISVLIVEKPRSEVALHVESTCPVVSKEGGVAKMDAQAAGLESTSINIFPPISEEEPPPAVEPVCRVTSSLACGTSKASQSFPALGIEWPDGPQFGLALGSPEVAAQLVQSLDLLLQVDPLPTVEAMRRKLEECTRGYHAFGLPRDTWIAKLAALWDEFAYLHASQEQRQRTKMIIQQEELLYRLRATRAEVHTQVEAARDRGWRAALRAKVLQSKVQALLQQARVAEEECNSAQVELETLQCKLDGLQGKVLLSVTRIAELRRRGS